MTTLSDLAARVLQAVDDATETTWTAAEIKDWIRDGIRDYSQYFPRRLQAAIPTTAGEHVYDLPETATELLLVEYPVGEDPPVYLHYRSRSHPQFWNRDGYYDYRLSNAAGSAPEICLSAAPPAGQTIAVNYLAPHDIPAQDAGVLTVPGVHEPLIILYAIMSAWQHRLGKEQQAPTSNSSLLLTQFAANADRARRNYVQALQRARIAAAGRSVATPWKMDKYDRIY